MEMKLEELLASISLSVQQAGQTIDHDAADTFLKLADSTVEIVSEKGGKTKMPVAALMHHRPLLLDEVSIRMKTSLKMEKGSIYVETAQNKTGEEEVQQKEPPAGQTEILLTYKGSDPSQGIARITEQMNRNL